MVKVEDVPDKGRAKISYTSSTSLFTRLFQYVFFCTVIHYLLWNVAMFALSCVAIWYGYGYVVVTLVALYLPFFLDGAHLKGGKPWDAFRKHPIWEHCCEYLSLTLVREKELDPSKKYIFGLHPHGIIILSRVLGYAGHWEKLFPGINWRVLAATPMFFLPGCREMCLWLNAVDACRSSAEKLLDNGTSLLVYPGGSKEIFRTDPHSLVTDLVLEERLGFVKLAIRKGADLVPCFVYGEKYSYHQWNGPPWLQNFFLKFKLPFIVFWGRYFTWMPYRAPLGVVFGTPIEVKQKDEPTLEEVKKLHAVYCKKLSVLFEKHKKEFGYDAAEKIKLC